MFKPLFYTSLLFAIPIAYAYHNGVYDVALASLICLTTSVIAHGTLNNSARKIDTFVVRAIAAFYVFIAFTIVMTSEWPRYKMAALTIAFGLATLYVFLRYKSTIGHAFVHVLAVSGIMSYIAIDR